jgi:hypothetical protein
LSPATPTGDAQQALLEADGVHITRHGAVVDFAVHTYISGSRIAARHTIANEGRT